MPVVRGFIGLALRGCRRDHQVSTPSTAIASGSTKSESERIVRNCSAESWKRDARDSFGRIEIASTSPISQLTLFTNRLRLL